MSRTIELIAGLILLLVGVVVLASEPFIGFVRGLGIGDDVLRWWPVLIIGLSLFFLLPSLLGRQNRRLRAGMVIPGAILAGVGGTADRVGGNIQEGWGTAKRKVGETIEDIGDSIKR